MIGLIYMNIIFGVLCGSWGVEFIYSLVSFYVLLNGYMIKCGDFGSSSVMDVG